MVEKQRNSFRVLYIGSLTISDSWSEKCHFRSISGKFSEKFYCTKRFVFEFQGGLLSYFLAIVLISAVISILHNFGSLLPARTVTVEGFSMKMVEKQRNSFCVPYIDSLTISNKTSSLTVCLKSFSVLEHIRNLAKIVTWVIGLLIIHFFLWDQWRPLLVMVILSPRKWSPMTGWVKSHPPIR